MKNTIRHTSAYPKRCLSMPRKIAKEKMDKNDRWSILDNLKINSKTRDRI
jgi:hypothetical protein